MSTTYLAVGPDKRTQWWELPSSWDQHRAHQALEKALSGDVVHFEIVTPGGQAVLQVNGANLAAAAIVELPEQESVLDSFVQT